MKTCLWCTDLNMNCGVCGKKKKKKVVDKKNEYGCHCHRLQFCPRCRIAKIEKQAVKDHEKFLETTSFKLVKFNMSSTGDEITDNEVKIVHGNNVQDPYQGQIHDATQM